MHWLHLFYFFYLQLRTELIDFI